MTAGNWIALYGAITATAAILWQVAIHLDERRPKLRVKAMLMHFVFSTDEMEAAAKDPDSILSGEWRLQAGILN